MGSAVVDFYVLAIPAGALIENGYPVPGAIFAIAAFGWGFWNAWLAGTTGQSTGKRLLRTRLQAADGSGLIGGRAGIVRCALHLLDSLPSGLGYLWPLWDPAKQTFADKLAASVVVKVDRRI